MSLPAPHRSRPGPVRTGGNRLRTSARPALRRDPEHGYTGGLCQAVAVRQGIDPVLVRVLTIILALSCGLGLGLYLTFWSLTPSIRHDEAPLDRVLPASRRWGPTAVWVYGLLVTGLVVLLVGQLTPLGWWPAIVLLLAWCAVRALDRRQGSPARPTRARTRHTASPRALHILTWTSLSAALLAGVLTALTAPHWTTLSRLVCGASAALLVVGLGLVLGARWGLSRILRNCGIVLGLAVLSLDAPYLVVASDAGTTSSFRFTDATTLPAAPLVIDDNEADIDLSALGGDAASITVQANNAVVEISTPTDRPVRVDYECTGAQVRVPSGSGCSGMGSGVWSSGARTGELLQVHVRARGSDVEVTP